MDLSFRNTELARLCNKHAALVARLGDEAAAIEQLLYELDCAECLGQVEELPHVLLQRAPQGRIGVHGDYEAGVLLSPQLSKSKSFRDAEAAVIVAVSVGEEDFNPEGATWPRLSATSRTTR